MLKSIVTAMLLASTSGMKLKGLQREELNGETVKRVEDYGKPVEISDKSFRVPVEVVSSGRHFMIKLENLEDVDLLIVTECSFVLKDLINNAEIRTIQEESQNKEHSKLHYLAQTLRESRGWRAVEQLQAIVNQCTVGDGRQECVAALFRDIIAMFHAPNYSMNSIPPPSGDRVKDLTEEGNQHYGMGDDVKALELFGESLALENEQAEVHNNVANIYRRKEDWKRTLHHYREAVRIEPDDARWLCNLGGFLWTFDSARCTDGAIWYLRKAVELSPDYVNAIVPLALALSEDKGEHDAAIFLMNKAIVALPKNRECICTFDMDHLLEWRRKFQDVKQTAAGK